MVKCFILFGFLRYAIQDPVGGHDFDTCSPQGTLVLLLGQSSTDSGQPHHSPTLHSRSALRARSSPAGAEPQANPVSATIQSHPETVYYKGCFRHKSRARNPTDTLKKEMNVCHLIWFHWHKPMTVGGCAGHQGIQERSPHCSLVLPELTTETQRTHVSA